jgi:hypothetical protein
MHRSLVVAVLSVLSLVVSGLGVSAANSSPSGSASSYFSLTPARVLDTRTGLGTQGCTLGCPLGAGSTITLQITGCIEGGCIPPCYCQPPLDTLISTAVVLNVTVTNGTAPSFLTVWPSTEPRPLASNLNWVAGQTIPNLVSVALGSTGAISFYNAAGTVDVIADREGYYAPGSSGAVGPQGPAGPAGATGPAGVAGPAGVVGGTGADGAIGPVGPVGPQGVPGPAGAIGPVGPAGPQGPVGTDGLHGYHVVVIPFNGTVGIAACLPGEVPLGGGFSGANVTASFPAASIGWEVNTSQVESFAVYVICATP